MFDYLSGTLIENNPTSVVLDVQGVGYKLWVPHSTIHPLIGETCTLYTSLVIRENAHTLYAFADKSLRNLFEILIGVSGIGPKTALGILSQFSAHSFQEAVINENIPLISSVPGLGKKTAEKMILELKDKLLKCSFSDQAPSKNSSQHYDAMQALVNLGYSERSASKALEDVMKKQQTPLPLSELITEVLRSR